MKNVKHIGCYFTGEIQQLRLHFIVTSSTLCVITELGSITWPRNFVVHHERMVLGALDSGDRVTGPEATAGLIAAALGDRAGSLFAWIMVDKGPDGVLRKGRSFFRDAEGGRAASLAARAVQLHSGRNPQGEQPFFLPDFSVDWRTFPTVAWSDLEALLQRRPDFFKDRLVLVGAEFAGAGDQDNLAPHPSKLPGRLSGLRFQALCIQTLLAQSQVRPAGVEISAVLLGTILFLLGWPLLARENTSSVLLLSLSLSLVFPLLAWFLLTSFRLMVPVIGPLALGIVHHGILLALRPIDLMQAFRRPASRQQERE